jgi:hypothetical protein
MPLNVSLNMIMACREPSAPSLSALFTSSRIEASLHFNNKHTGVWIPVCNAQPPAVFPGNFTDAVPAVCSYLHACIGCAWPCTNEMLWNYATLLFGMHGSKSILLCYTQPNLTHIHSQTQSVLNNDAFNPTTGCKDTKQCTGRGGYLAFMDVPVSICSTSASGMNGAGLFSAGELAGIIIGAICGTLLLGLCCVGC